MTQRQIVVVGAGVVGLALAISLQRAGFDTVLVERGGAPPPFDPARYDPRVYALAPASVTLLRDLGVWPQVVHQRASAYTHMRVWDRDPSAALEFDAGALHASELGFIVENGLLQSELWKTLAAGTGLPATEVAALRPEAGEVTLAGGRVLRAQLVVAADGTDSPLREMAGIDAAGWTYPQRAVVCHVDHGQPHRHTALQRFLPEGPLAFLPLADGRSSIVWSSTAAPELLALDDAAFAARLGEAIQGQLGPIRGCTPRLSFGLRLLHAERYVADRLVLAGDAAHSIHPLAGQGVNLGLGDAAALVRHLVEAREQGRDWSGPRVLRAYERERKAANLEMLALTEGLYRAFRSELPGLQSVLHAGLRLVERSGLVKRELVKRAAGLG